jgi:AcrR family transcriptional regulator
VAPKKQNSSRDRLLLAARKLFSRQGFAETSTRQIASDAGCNLALINHYFGSKEGLLVAILEAEMRTAAPRLQTALLGSGSAADRLTRFIDHGIDHFAEDGEFLRIAHREIIQQGSRLLPTLVPPIEGVIGEIARRFQDARAGTEQAALDPRLSALLLVGAMQFYFIAYPLASKLVGKESDALKAQLKRQITAFFVNTLAEAPRIRGSTTRLRRAPRQRARAKRRSSGSRRES